MFVHVRKPFVFSGALSPVFLLRPLGEKKARHGNWKHIKKKTGEDVVELILFHVGCVWTLVAMVVGPGTHENCAAISAHCAPLDGMARRPLPPQPTAKRVRLAF